MAYAKYTNGSRLGSGTIFGNAFVGGGPSGGGGGGVVRYLLNQQASLKYTVILICMLRCLVSMVLKFLTFDVVGVML